MTLHLKMAAQCVLSIIQEESNSVSIQSNLSKNSFESSRLNWYLKTYVDGKTKETWHLALGSGAASADVYYSCKSHSGRITVSKGKCVDLGIPCQYKLPGPLKICVLRANPLVAHSKIQPFLDDHGVKDVKLYFGTDEEPALANKLILMVRSSVFKKMFESGLKEVKSNEVKIPDISSEVGQEMVSYMYTNEAPNVSKMPKDLWVAADKYELPGLKMLCEDELGVQLTIENATETLMFANAYCGEGRFKDFVLWFITQDKDTCKRVMETEGWSEVCQLPELVLDITDTFFEIQPKRSRQDTA